MWIICTNADKLFDEEQEKESGLPTKCWEVGPELSLPEEPAAASSTIVSPNFDEFSHYQTYLPSISANDKPQISEHQREAASSIPSYTPPIGTPTVDRNWRTQASIAQSELRDPVNNGVPFAFPRSAADVLSNPSPRTARAGPSIILDNDISGNMSARPPGDGKATSSSTDLPGQPRNQTRPLGARTRSIPPEHAEVPSNDNFRDSSRDYTKNLAARSLQCPICPKTFKRRHELKYVATSHSVLAF